MPGICFHLDGKGNDAVDFGMWSAAALVVDDIDTLAIIGRIVESTSEFDGAMGLCEYANLDQFLDDHRDRSLAFVCSHAGPATASIPLWRFDHNVDWYVFGNTSELDPYFDLAISIPRVGGEKLSLEQTAATTLLHRYWVKQGAPCGNDYQVHLA